MTTSSIPGEALRILYSFDYKRIDESFKDLMANLAQIFDAKSAMLFMQREGRPCLLSAASNDSFRSRTSQYRDLCIQHRNDAVRSQEFQLEREDKTKEKVTLFNFKMDTVNYSIALVDGMSLDDCRTLADIITLCINKIMSDVELFRTETMVDKMTGVYSRNAYEERIKELKNQSSIQQVVVSFVDIFSLKKMNKECGHDGGDLYIKEVAKVLKTHTQNCVDPNGQQIFPNGVEIFRIGGDEFLLLAITSTDAETITEILSTVLDNAKRDVEEQSYAIAKAPNMTSLDHGESCGLTSDIGRVIKEADDRLIASKQEHYQKIGLDRRQS